ncbi:MAG: hypothetical protein KA163_07330 [Bacteroidia bacterium]|nr:hypothetical protein [Bacteroidia bacterium]
MVFALLFFNWLQSYAQVCTGCKTTITSNTSANITIGFSDVVCIAPGVSATGNITVNGGTLCNEGTVTNLTLVEGYFYNHGVFSKPTGNLNITNAKNLWIECFTNSRFDLTNAMNIDALTNSDSVMIKVWDGAQFSVGKSMSVSKGWLKITNAIPNAAARAPGSFFNIGGQLNVSNAALRILNYPFGIFNINNAVNLEGKYNKTILNYGLFSCNNSFNISGNGQNSYNVQIENNGTFNIARHLNSAYNNGTVTINNNDYPVKPEPTFAIGKSLTLSKSNNTFNNKIVLTVEQDIFLENGSLTNTRNVYVNRDVEIKNGLLSSGGSLFVLRDFLLTNNSAVVNNDNELRIGRLFSSKGTVNFGKKSYMLTKNFTHLNGGFIYGPADLQDPVDPTIGNDSSNYALIDITDYSDNNGDLRQHLIVYDENFSGMGIALDDYHGNTARLGMPPVIIGRPPCFRNIFDATLTSNVLNLCTDGSAILTANGFNIITSAPAPVSSYFWTPSNTTTFPPTNTFNTGIITSNTTFGVSVTFANGCVVSKNVTINVSNLSVSSNAVSASGLGNTFNINAVVSGGTSPFAFNWLPNSFFVSPNTHLQQNSVVNPPVSMVYTVTVTDAFGCIKSSTVAVVILPYALLSKKPDGGYYKVVNNSMLFKYDGQYANTNLKYNVYNYSASNLNQVMASNTNNISNSLLVVSGDNRYTLNTTTLPNGNYLLEVINEKSEKLYLRFTK